MTWLSPSFPVGAFSYSSGIEWAVEAGDITDAASLARLAGGDAGGGSGFCDGVFLAHAHRAASTRDERRLREIAELAAAFVPSRERQLETSAQGRAFIDIARSAWTCDGLDGWSPLAAAHRLSRRGRPASAPAHAIPLAPAMHAFLHALVSNWISAGARLMPLGQTDSQRVLARARAGGRRHRQARAASLARRSRQRDISRRSRQPAARDAIYEAVPVMTASIARRPCERRDP